MSAVYVAILALGALAWGIVGGVLVYDLQAARKRRRVVGGVVAETAVARAQEAFGEVETYQPGNTRPPKLPPLREIWDDQGIPNSPSSNGKRSRKKSKR